jgi:ABC-type Fe3+/spermidine/putrescine transport system ATPase subunit
VPSSETLRVSSISVQWGPEPVLREVSLAVGPGEYVTLVGPNGAGKTTLLRTIVGLERPAQGRVLLGDRDLTDVPVHRRGLGYVSQEPSLFPHRTVEENVAYGLFVRGAPLGEARRRVDDLLQRLDLDRLARRYPRELSGGEQQKVQLARALAPDPPFVLLDEPFAAVDPEFRAELRAEFRSVLHRQGSGAIHVTHDRDEGLFLGDRMALLLGGRLAQVGPPLEVYASPVTPEVARFLGYNLLEADGREVVALAPEALVLDGPEGVGGVSGTIVASGPIAAGWATHVRLEDGRRVVVHAGTRPARWTAGESVRVRWGPGREKRFPTSG